MISYSATLQIDQATRELLKTKGYTLYLFKGIDAGAGATSTVWLTISGNQLYNQSSNTISWYEDYYIGEESTEIQNDSTISGTNPYVTSENVLSVSLGQNYIFPGTAWTPQATNQPINTAFTIQNSDQSVNNFYVSQSVTSGDAPYIVVTELLGSGGLGTFTPIETIAMILATQSYSTGTMITEAFSPGAIITLSNTTSAALAYNKDKGWSVSAGQLTLLDIGDLVYDSMLGAAGGSTVTAGRYPGAPLIAPLSNNKTTNSHDRVAGVRLMGISGVNYAPGGFATVRGADRSTSVPIGNHTDRTVDDLGAGVYHVTNNSGGTIEYEWV